ncbi:DUF1801 domain-containing protein [Aquimarina sp. 2-A2]|uniref:DUF1801 domain-containing protein n=1 Tax=Aquimarina sp. 2-A2 TaxID=3382644 RepID=UPI00387EEF10
MKLSTILVNNVDKYIEQQDLEISLIVSTIRDIILSCAIQIRGEIKHRIPFFSYHSNICYINVRNRVVDLGFVNGYLLSNHQGVLDEKDRKSVRTITFKSIGDVNKGLIRELVFEAILIDEEKKKKHNRVDGSIPK